MPASGKQQKLSAQAYFSDMLKNPGFKLPLCRRVTTQNEVFFRSQAG
ncbi:hypothetical protein [Methylomonas albis]|nr:hypothetical protein [Methylomonas albis]